jgi:hypothetical protein
MTIKTAFRLCFGRFAVFGIAAFWPLFGMIWLQGSASYQSRWQNE